MKSLYCHSSSSNFLIQDFEVSDRLPTLEVSWCLTLTQVHIVREKTKQTKMKEKVITVPRPL